MTFSNNLTALILATLLSSTCFGQAEADTSAKFIAVYIDKWGNLFVDGERRTLTGLDEYLATTKLKQAKLASIFPTPLRVFATIDKVHSRLELKNINVIFYKDRAYTQPAFDD
jgi:hypothetical protein